MLHRSEKRTDPRSGVTLVELLAAVLILTIVFFGWVRMNNLQAVRMESFRYAAVEKAAGLLDAVTPELAILSGLGFDQIGRAFRFTTDGEFGLVEESEQDGIVVLPLFSEKDRIGFFDSSRVPIGYRCHLETWDKAAATAEWGGSNKGAWLVMDLYDESGTFARNDARLDSPFASFSVFLVWEGLMQ